LSDLSLSQPFEPTLGTKKGCRGLAKQLATRLNSYSLTPPFPPQWDKEENRQKIKPVGWDKDSLIKLQKKIIIIVIILIIVMIVIISIIIIIIMNM